MWRCPHCGAPQAESARCWVCHRSSTTCSTCRHFQTALSADVGWCARDPKRLPLTGFEQRGCWQARAATTPLAPTDADARAAVLAGEPATDDDGAAWAGSRLDFIPVELIRPVTASTQQPADEAAQEVVADAELPHAGPPIVAHADDSWTERTSLFGEPEG